MASCLNSKTLIFQSSPLIPRIKLSKNHASFYVSRNPKKTIVSISHASFNSTPNPKITRIPSTVQTFEAERMSDYAKQLTMIADIAADRAEMHAIIGQQRNNWNHLFLYTITSMNLFASLMTGLSSLKIPETLPIHLAFKISLTLLFSFSTLMMIMVNLIQPSQLAEEQRSAYRLFKQLDRSIRTSVCSGYADRSDINEAIERVLALDRAYPLSLVPGMLDKFPKKVEPATWWPQFDFEHSRRREKATIDNETNGWNKELEEEMNNLLTTLKRKDEHQYLVCGKLPLKINRILAILGPFFSTIATIGSILIGFRNFGSIPVIVSLTCGPLAVITNALEHGGQIGMVFEIFRNCAGFYKELEEEIEANLEERNLEKRESGELFETKMALKLGRSAMDLKNFRLNGNGDNNGEFAGKLF